MRVHYLYCHPQTTSFHAAILTRALAGLAAAHHEVDLLDLYADKFDPVMWEEEAARLSRHVPQPGPPLADYIARLRARRRADSYNSRSGASACRPCSRVISIAFMMPGVAFDLSRTRARSRPFSGNLRRHCRNSDLRPPRAPGARRRRSAAQMVKRYLPWFANWRARVDYYALYHMNSRPTRIGPRSLIKWSAK